MIIRHATKNDNEALLDLCKKAPMQGVVTAYVDQSPDFFTMPSLQGEDFTVWVAEDKGVVCGCVVEAYKTILYNGKFQKIFYIGDLKVAPESRGTLGLKLSIHVVNEAKSKGFALGECYIIDGNLKMTKVVDWLSTKIFTKENAGFAEIFQLIPLKKYTVNKKYNIRTATESDVSEISALLHSSYSSYSSSPFFSENSLAAILKSNSFFSIDNFLVAEVNGKIVACTSFWDQSSIRRTVVTKFSGYGKIGVTILKLLRPLTKLPNLPNEGDMLKYIYLRFPAALNNNIDALQSILHYKSNLIRKEQKYHFIWAGFHQADPLSQIVNKMWKMKMKVNIIHFKFLDGVDLIPESECVKQPVFVDFSVV